MADAKITELSEDTAPALTDLLASVEDPAGTPVTKKITVAKLLGLAYPVGSIYISTNSTNPATSLGFGTWSAFGAGRVPVGFDSGDADFDTDEETGGSKTHSHTLSDAGQAKVLIKSGNATGLAVNSENWTSTRTNTGGGSASTAETQGSGLMGSTDSGSNLSPYIVVRMWKRTA